MNNIVNLSKWIDDGYANKPAMRWPTFDGKELDRSKYMTSSEAGYCSRRIKFRQMVEAKDGPSGFPNWGYAERGNIIEEWAVSMLRSGMPDTVKLDWAGTDQVSFHSGYQSGTPDGHLRDLNTGRDYTVEIKSIDPRTSYAKLPKNGHMEQVQQNMDLVERCTGIEIYGAILLYIDASNLQKRSERFIDRDIDLMDHLERKAVNIATAKTPDDLPAEGLFTAGECGMCDFKARCSAVVEAEKKEAAAFKHHERVTTNVFR